MKKIVLTLLTICLMPILSLSAVGPNWIEQYGITWTFDKNISSDGSGDTYQYGQFVNGDYWIVGPVTIVDINPPKQTILQDGQNWQVNGSQINPNNFNVAPSPAYPQGFDSRMGFYDDQLNLGAPLVLMTNQSLISSDSWLFTEDGCPPREDSRPEYWKYYIPRQPLRVVAVLTALQSAPQPGTFRPAPVGDEKRFHNINNMNTSIWPNLAPAGNRIRNWDAYRNIMTAYWNDHHTFASGSYTRPEETAPYDGQSLANQIQQIACLLLLDESTMRDQYGFPSGWKYDLSMRLTQLGIDNYGIVKTGGGWGYTGGQIGHGRKLPILVAGILLDDPEMKNVGYDYGFTNYEQRQSHKYFAEDCQKFYTRQEDIDRWSFADKIATRYNCRVDASDPTLIIDDNGLPWYIADDGVSEIKARAERSNYDYWLIWNYGSPNEEKVRIVGVNHDGSGNHTMRLLFPVAAGSGKTARVQLFPQQRLGLPEWGERHFYNYAGDFFSRGYQILTASTLAGHQLVALILKTRDGSKTMKELWNWDPFFDFIDYHMDKMEYGSSWRVRKNFVEDLWDKYRGDYGGIYSEAYSSEGRRAYIINGVVVIPGAPDEPESDSGEHAGENIVDGNFLYVRNNLLQKGSAETAVIICQIRGSGLISVKIFNSKGQEIITIWEGYKEAGTHSYYWGGVDASGKKVGSGVYFVSLQSGGFKDVKKIVVVK